MAKKQTKKNKKKNAGKKKKTMTEGESSAMGEKTDSSERDSSPEPEAAELGDTSSAGKKKIDGGDTKAAAEEEKEVTPPVLTERERIEEEDSWIKQQDSSERKPSSVLFAKVPILLFSTKLDSGDADPAQNRVALKLCHQKMKVALTLTQSINKIPYVGVLARDPQKREYELRISKFDGTFALHHGWAKIVAENGLKEGDIVMGKGIYVDHHYRVVLSFTKDISRERNLFGSGRTFFLFEKKLDKADLKWLLVISCCSERLKVALRLTKEPYIRVFAKGEQRMELLELRFSRNVGAQGEGTYILYHQWENIVAKYGLKEGDLVTGFGNVYSIGFLMVIRVIKKEEMGLPILSHVPILYFEKKLESTDTNDRLAIESCKDVVKEIVGRAEKQVGDSDGYVRVIAVDERDRPYELRLSRDTPEGSYVLHHQWRDVVAANGLRSGDTVSCWGGLAGDGTIQMKFDVFKAS